MIALALLLALQQPDTNTTLPPSVRAMLEQLPLPHADQPVIAVRFSHDTVWVGAQVELITAIWFPRGLRDRLRRQPNIAPPSLTGLWSARNQQQPVQAETRMIGRQLYDLYVSYETIFPLAAGRIVAPPASLSFGVPVSTSYFAPEERHVLHSTPATLIVRPVPAALAAAVGNGPTAENLQVAWRGPAAALHVGAPVIVELIVAGRGNLTLWPAPTIHWPVGVHVYPEMTEEHSALSRSMIAGEKHFRFTVVADTTGVLTLPAVSYPYFDPETVTAGLAISTPFELPVLPRTGEETGRQPLPLVPAGRIVWPAVVWRDGWPVVLALMLLALWPAWRQRHQRRSPVVVMAPDPADPEATLRAALGTPVEAGPDHVVAALRARGVARDEAEHIHRWLRASARRRYGPHTGQEPPQAPGIVSQVLARLRRPMGLALVVLLGAPPQPAGRDGASRYNHGDYAGAARDFAERATSDPANVSAWTNLGAAEFMGDDDVRAAAAWLNGLRIAPRDPALQDDWAQLPAVPPDIRALAPTVPLSRDELFLLAALAWCVAWLAFAQYRRRIVWGAAGIGVAALLLAIVRWRSERSDLAIASANTTLRISPQPSTPAIGDLGIWSSVHVQRMRPGWYLIDTDVSSPATGFSVTTEGWVPASAIAPVGPLD